MTSGGSSPQGVPSPQKVASLRPRASGLLAIAKSCGYFSGPLPPFLRAASPYSSFRAKKQALRRPERYAAQVQPCLSLPEPPPPRERRFAFPGSQVFGTGTLPVGFQGRSALVAPKGAKSPFRKLAHGVFSPFTTCILPYSEV